MKSSFDFVVWTGVGISFIGPVCQAYFDGVEGVVGTVIVVVVVVDMVDKESCKVCLWC